LSILIAAGVGIGVKKIKDNYYSKKWINTDKKYLIKWWVF
jgi:hypothetical protein